MALFHLLSSVLMAMTAGSIQGRSKWPIFLEEMAEILPITLTLNQRAVGSKSYCTHHLNSWNDYGKLVGPAALSQISRSQISGIW